MAGQQQAGALPAADGKWWVHHNNEAKGPYEAGHLVAWLSDGSMPPDTLICPAGGQQWLPVARWPQLTVRLPSNVLAAVEQAAPKQRDLGDDPAMRLLLPVGRSLWAIAAGYLGLLSPLFVFAPFALLCSILAILDIRAHPERHGMGRAVFGLAMGLGFSILLVVIVIGMSSGTI